jgi:hypothetical protein
LSEWWTYRPHDFLMFSPAIYWRLFESLNLAWWPVQPLLAAAALALLHPRAMRWMPCLLALAWALSGWAFVWQRYTPIQWVAAGFAWAFFVQALLWLGLAVSPAGWPVTTVPLRQRAGLVLAVAALLLYPLLAPLAARPWVQAECFGLAPDPTALVSLALLLTLQTHSASMRWWLRLMALLPLAWCLFSAATLLVMGAWQGAVLGGALVVLALAAWRLPHHRGDAAARAR